MTSTLDDVSLNNNNINDDKIKINSKNRGKNEKTVRDGPPVIVVDPDTKEVKYADTQIVHFSRGRASRKLNKYTNITLVVSIVFILLALPALPSISTSLPCNIQLEYL